MPRIERDYVLAYKTFKTTEDFEQWQLDNPDIDVLTMQPFAGQTDINFKTVEKECDTGCMEISTVVFVVYKKPKGSTEDVLHFYENAKSTNTAK